MFRSFHIHFARERSPGTTFAVAGALTSRRSEFLFVRNEITFARDDNRICKTFV